MNDRVNPLKAADLPDEVKAELLRRRDAGRPHRSRRAAAFWHGVERVLAARSGITVIDVA
jgi:hypothetical protein